MFKIISDLFVQPHNTITEALEVLNISGIGVVLIVDEESRLLGTLTDGDVRRALIQGIPMIDHVDSIMNHHPVTATIGTPRMKLLGLMHTRRKRQIPLVDDDHRVVDIAWQNQLMELDMSTHPFASVVILCGGLGTRLRPLTNEKPKPLLPVGGKPVLEHIIKALAESGFRQIYLAVNYMADQIQEYFSDGHQWGVQIEYALEKKSLGTAGALSLLQDRLNEPTIILNGDLLTGVDYGKIYNFHIDRKFDLTIGVKPYQIQVPYGVVNLNGDYVQQLSEKPVYSFFTNAGIYILNPEVISLIPYDEYHDMTDLISLVLAQHGRVGAFPFHEYWLDVGRHDDYVQAQEDIISKKVV